MCGFLELLDFSIPVAKYSLSTLLRYWIRSQNYNQQKVHERHYVGGCNYVKLVDQIARHAESKTFVK